MGLSIKEPLPSFQRFIFMVMGNVTTTFNSRGGNQKENTCIANALDSHFRLASNDNKVSTTFSSRFVVIMIVGCGLSRFFRNEAERRRRSVDEARRKNTLDKLRAELS